MCSFFEFIVSDELEAGGVETSSSFNGRRSAIAWEASVTAPDGGSACNAVDNEGFSAGVAMAKVRKIERSNITVERKKQQAINAATKS